MVAMTPFHCVGLLHNDLHWGNVMLDKKNNIRVIDYDRVIKIEKGTIGREAQSEGWQMKQKMKVLLGLHLPFGQSKVFRKLHRDTYGVDPVLKASNCNKVDPAEEENTEHMECFLSKLEERYLGYSLTDGRVSYCELFEKGDLTVEKMFLQCKGANLM